MEMQASGKGAVVEDPVEALVQVVASVTFSLRIQDGRPIASAQVHTPQHTCPDPGSGQHIHTYTYIHICVYVHLYPPPPTHTHTHTS